MRIINTALTYFKDKVNIDTLEQTANKTAEYISTGGIQPAYFLGTVLFIIFIMIALLLIKIMNIKQSEKSGNIKI